MLKSSRGGTVSPSILALSALAVVVATGCAGSSAAPSRTACLESGTGSIWQDWDEGVLDPPALRDHLARVGRAHATSSDAQLAEAVEVVGRAAEAASDEELRGTIAAIEAYDLASDPIGAAIATIDRRCGEVSPQ